MLCHGIEIASSRGLEFGPLDKPIVTPTDGNITYVDACTLEALRALHADNPRVDTAAIVAPDLVWTDGRLAACLPAAPFDYAIASHVAEHVPDVIGWLADIETVLRPGGELRLAMPDCRFSSDVLRRPTALIDVLANHVSGARRPTPANVLDHFLHHAPGMDGWGRYEGRFDMAQVRPQHTVAEAAAIAAAARDDPDRYIDVHCWVFQPRSFAAIMAALAAEGLVRYECARLIDPTMPLLEFYAFLRPCADARRAAASWTAAAAQAADPLPGSAEARQGLATLRVEAELAALRASRSWRVTAPLRGLHQWIAARH